MPGWRRSVVHSDGLRPYLCCDRCGATFADGDKRKQLRDNAKFIGWRELHPYGAVRDYCPACAEMIECRKQARKGN